MLAWTEENAVLARWNKAPMEAAALEVLSCCGSMRWARGLAELRPFEQADVLLQLAREVWAELSEQDWMEAFRSHPRLGERHAERETTATSAQWSATEQSSVTASGDAVKRALAEGNRRYEERFGRIFILCAAGRPAEEMLGELERRLRNEDAAEMRESAQEQEKIMLLRLRRWLEQEKES